MATPTLDTLANIVGGAIGLKCLEFGFGFIQKFFDSRTEPEVSIQNRITESLLKRVDQVTAEREKEVELRREVEKERDEWVERFNAQGKITYDERNEWQTKFNSSAKALMLAEFDNYKHLQEIARLLKIIEELTKKIGE